MISRTGFSSRFTFPAARTNRTWFVRPTWVCGKKNAGVGTASDACLTMEQGVDGILMNTALAAARDPVAMARAMRQAVEAGRTAYLAGRMAKREVAMPSSPLEGMLD